MVSLLQDPSLGLQDPLCMEVALTGGRITARGFTLFSFSLAMLLLFVFAFSVSTERRVDFVMAG